MSVVSIIVILLLEIHHCILPDDVFNPLKYPEKCIPVGKKEEYYVISTLPKLYISDSNGYLDVNVLKRLNNLAQDLENKKSIQLFVVIINISDISFEEFGKNIFDRFEIGGEKQKGFLILADNSKKTHNVFSGNGVSRYFFFHSIRYIRAKMERYRDYDSNTWDSCLLAGAEDIQSLLVSYWSELALFFGFYIGFGLFLVLLVLFMCAPCIYRVVSRSRERKIEKKSRIVEDHFIHAHFGFGETCAVCAKPFTLKHVKRMERYMKYLRIKDELTLNLPRIPPPTSAELLKTSPSSFRSKSSRYQPLINTGHFGTSSSSSSPLFVCLIPSARDPPGRVSVAIQTQPQLQHLPSATEFESEYGYEYESESDSGSGRGKEKEDKDDKTGDGRNGNAEDGKQKDSDRGDSSGVGIGSDHGSSNSDGDDGGGGDSGSDEANWDWGRDYCYSDSEEVEHKCEVGKKKNKRVDGEKTKDKALEKKMREERKERRRKEVLEDILEKYIPEFGSVNWDEKGAEVSTFGCGHQVHATCLRPFLFLFKRRKCPICISSRLKNS